MSVEGRRYWLFSYRCRHSVTHPDGRVVMGAAVDRVRLVSRSPAAMVADSRLHRPRAGVNEPTGHQEIVRVYSAMPIDVDDLTEEQFAELLP